MAMNDEDRQPIAEAAVAAAHALDRKRSVRIWYDATRSVSLEQLSELAGLEETLCLDSRRQSMGRSAGQDGAADLSDRLGIG